MCNLHTVCNLHTMCDFTLCAICAINLRCFVARPFLSEIYALLSVKFSGLKMCGCKKNDKFQVCGEARIMKQVFLQSEILQELLLRALKVLKSFQALILHDQYEWYDTCDNEIRDRRDWTSWLIEKFHKLLACLGVMNCCLTGHNFTMFITFHTVSHVICYCEDPLIIWIECLVLSEN